MVKNPDKAIYNKRFCGPAFGTKDIRIDRYGNSKKNYSTTNIGNDYSVPSSVRGHKTILAGIQKFHPDEVEVFYLKVT